jgi:hypothetical protein
MIKNLKALIDDYLADVANGIDLFKLKIGDKNPLKAWRDNDIPQKGNLTDDVKYELHGIGCLLVYPEYEVDFDFGPDERIDGFDLWRLSQYVAGRVNRYPEYEDTNNLKRDFEQAVNNGEISKIDHPYCNLYFYS